MVEHAKYGVGVVRRVMDRGRLIYARFENDLIITSVRAEDLMLVKKDGSRVPAVIKISPAVNTNYSLPPGDKGTMEALRTIEALRSGVAPGSAAQLFTVGRSLEMQMVANDLAEAKEMGAARVFMGDYGSGKTHMLDCIRDAALSNNFIVARVTLDGINIMPSHPKRVYRELVRSIEYPDSGEFGEGGMVPLLSRACQNPKVMRRWSSAGENRHPYITPALKYFDYFLKNESMTESDCAYWCGRMLDWIEGHPTISNIALNSELKTATRCKGQRLFALQDHQTLAHLYANVLGGISVLAHDVGYSGLVILVDEAEFFNLLSRHAQEMGNLLFLYYCAAALGKDGVKVDVMNSLRGGHHIHRSWTPIFRYPQFMYCVFALTADEGLGERTLRNILDDNKFAYLRELTPGDYKQMCTLVIQLYNRAYPGQTIGEKVPDIIGDAIYQCINTGKMDNPRLGLKLMVDLLDYSRLCHSEIRAYISELYKCINS